ncbi:hypothetical protein C8R46DRAFT_1304209 [Mycena filopes]|nr:hypothetical protein C8R46DRAFT_1304209 [Mycena filopes]
MPRPSGPTLTVNDADPGSPGSSVFDLPTQSAGPAPASQAHPSLKSASTSTGTNQPGASETSYVVISGGTGGNAICAAFGVANTCYVLPVSDDGGSSSEIIRVLGGPSIGDIRSRLVRLIPSAPAGGPLDAIRRLLAYRLPTHYSEREAREEWRDIIEGRSVLWSGIPNDRKETIRGFLVHFESELLKRAHKNFVFVNGSIGNYFLAAAQHFFRSLPASIFLFSSITNSGANILPVIVTNHTVTVAAELENGEKLVGQCEISHPVPSKAIPPNFTLNSSFNSSFNRGLNPGLEDTDADADGLSPVDADADGMGVREQGRGSSNSNMLFEQGSKGSEAYEPLGARISRAFGFLFP